MTEIYTYLLPVFLIAFCGVVVLNLAVFFSRYNYLKKLGIRAEGVIVDFLKKEKPRRTSYYPIYEFFYLDRNYTFTSPFGMGSKVGQIGDKVTIFVDPNNPEESIADGYKQVWLHIIIWLGILLLIGVIWIFGSIIKNN